ncbi:MAG: DUF1501 domain-containing protein [Planctomycetes bacterium]|nr:DUF1501 domain-containing protein [Planctomycetota bacterium]
MKNPFSRLDDISRREFAAGAAKTFLGVSLLPVAGAAFGAEEKKAVGKTIVAGKGTAQNVIYLYMSGGMTHLDTLDPKPGASTQGPVKPIKTSAGGGLIISEYLPKLARQMHNAVIVRSLSSTQGAHERGRYLMRTSYTQRGTIRHPALGAWLLKLSGRKNKSLPGNVRIGSDSRHPGAGFMEAAYAPLPIGNPTAGLQNSKIRGGTQTQFEKRQQLAGRLDRDFLARYNQKKVRSYTDAYNDAIRLMGSKELEAFNIYRESEKVRNAYGDNPFGQGCLLARRLVENDVRFVEVTLGGWDTHQNNFVRVPERTEILDSALGTLIADLSERGILEKTLVVLCSEFGRTPTINQNAGRDHYPKAFSTLLAGGGIRGGQVYGSTDAKGAEVETDPVEVPDFNATIAYALGLPLKKIVKSPSRRPFTVAHKGKPITKLF